jgi:Transposase DDE domain
LPESVDGKSKALFNPPLFGGFMETKIIFLYCLVDSILKALQLKDDSQSKMTQAEIITFAMISALFYQGNYKVTRQVMGICRYFPTILSHSRIVRRIHQVHPTIWTIIFAVCRDFIQNTACTDYIVDSFPIACCQNYKRFRCRLFAEKKYHGYCASKKQYFFGIKVHMVVNSRGIPIEFVFSPGNEADIRGLEKLELEIAPGSSLFADSAYTNYELEDFLKQERGIQLIPKRKKNAKRSHSPYDQLKLSLTRNRIETVFSGIVSLMPRYIRARTEKGFCLKVMFFILAYTIMLSF